MKRLVKNAAAATTFLGAIVIVAVGCLDRPVTSSPPAASTVFTQTVSNKAVDKVDLLFMIDNSPSMGDKQSLLALAVPLMIERLVTPNCLSTTTMMPTGMNSDNLGNCPAGSKVEFPPVHDMHIGIVSSSLGSRGGNVCPDNAMNPVNASLSAHNNDQGELINRGGVPGMPTVENSPGTADAPSPLNFLSYFPNVAANTGKPNPPTPPVTTEMTLVSDFTSLIAGVHEHGCGFEAQNEAWYRFLVQPDPFETININSGQASLSGVDDTILQQRADFLRPDSLVAIIVVTDENEEAADPLSIKAQGWAFDNQPFPGSASNGGAPEGTIQCQALDPNNPTTTGPNDPNCTSCAFNPANFATDCPKDGTQGAGGYLDPVDDAINLRFWHQKERFGLYAGYPISRYINGLQKTTVPSVGLAYAGDKDHEHDGNGNYIGSTNADCVNPLFAENLPTSSMGGKADLCHLTPGTRGAGLVYYAAIAGVPHQLLQAKPGDPECPSGTMASQCPQKTTLAPADWLLITGNNPGDPNGYDYSGADFHMVESDVPRTTNTGNWGTSASNGMSASTCPPPAMGLPSATCDPWNGSEFNTNKSDLEFSCIFPLVDTTGSTIAAFQKDCTSSQYTLACDCASTSLDMGTQLCDPTTPTTQINAKAYPSVREMQIAHAMSTEVINGTVSDQGIVSSLCPIALDIGESLSMAQEDPIFGYNPAVNAIVNRLKQSLNDTCVPQKLAPDPTTGDVQCLILVTLPAMSGSTCTNPGTACTNSTGLYGPGQTPMGEAAPTLSQDVLNKFCADQESSFINGGGKAGGTGDPANQPVCAIRQVSYATDTAHDQNLCSASGATPGWCYISGAAATALGCPDPYTITFTGGLPPGGATTALQCLETSDCVVGCDGGGSSGGSGSSSSSGGGGD